MHFRTLPPAAATVASARQSTESFCIACFRSGPRRTESAHLAWDTDAALFASRADIQSRQRSFSFPCGQRVLRVQSPHPDFTWLCGHGAQVAQWCFNLPCSSLRELRAEYDARAIRCMTARSPQRKSTILHEQAHIEKLEENEDQMVLRVWGGFAEAALCILARPLPLPAPPQRPRARVS